MKFQGGGEQNLGGMVELDLFSRGGRDPGKFLGFMIELHIGPANDAAGIIEKHEMGVAIKFLGMNTILHEHEADIGDLEVGFLEDFAAESSDSSFSPFDFAAGDAPFVGPFMGAHHEHFALAIEDKAADGGERREGRVFIGDRLEMEIVFLQHAAQFTEMFDDEFGAGGAQLVERVVAGEHGAGMNAAMPGGGDVMFHVADEKGFGGVELVFAEDVVDLFAFVEHIGVGLVEEGIQFADAALGLEQVAVDGAQQKGTQLVGAAKFEKGARVGQLMDNVPGLAELRLEPFFQLGPRYMRDVAIVKMREGQLEFRAELVERHGGLASLGEHEVGRLQDGGQIVHQRSGPIENNIADHRENLAARPFGRQEKAHFSLGCR